MQNCFYSKAPKEFIGDWTTKHWYNRQSHSRWCKLCRCLQVKAMFWLSQIAFSSVFFLRQNSPSLSAEMFFQLITLITAAPVVTKEDCWWCNVRVNDLNYKLCSVSIVVDEFNAQFQVSLATITQCSHANDIYETKEALGQSNKMIFFHWP